MMAAAPPGPGTEVPMDFETALSVDAVEEAARELAGEGPARQDLEALCQGEPAIDIRGLRAGYGRMGDPPRHRPRGRERASRSASSGPNGAGKSTVLHAVFGFADVMAGSIQAGSKDVTRLASSRRLADAGVAYVLQDNSVFPDMTVEENLLMGGFLLHRRGAARQAAERVFDRYDRLAQRRHRRAGVLSGGERRLLEISRALIMEPDVLLVDEPSIGLEPRFIDMVFEILEDLKRREGKTIVMVEQNAKKGLEFADIGYVLVSGRLAMAGPGDALLEDPEVGRLFLGA